MITGTVSDGVQLAAAVALYALAAGGPLFLVRRQHHRRRIGSWAAVVVLAGLSLLILPVGYVVVLLLSEGLGLAGWSLFNGDHGLLALIALLLAWATVFAASVLAAIVLIGRRLARKYRGAKSR